MDLCLLHLPVREKVDDDTALVEWWKLTLLQDRARSQLIYCAVTVIARGQLVTMGRTKPATTGATVRQLSGRI
jgi:hypothetical protein